MYELTQAANKDIEALFEDSLQRFGLPQTERYVSSLKSCLEMLGSNPQLGVSAEEIREGYRRFPHRSHVIFYQPAEYGVLVVRVLHKRMDSILQIEPD